MSTLKTAVVAATGYVLGIMTFLFGVLGIFPMFLVVLCGIIVLNAAVWVFFKCGKLAFRWAGKDRDISGERFFGLEASWKFWPLS